MAAADVQATPQEVPRQHHQANGSNMNRHQRRQHWKMSRKRSGDRRTMPPSNAGCSFEDGIKAFADYILQGTGNTPTIAISPLVWVIEAGCDTRTWLFHVGSASSAGKFRMDAFQCRADRDLAERSRIAMMVEFAGRGPVVIHEFDDELRFAEFCETMWPCERTTRIRVDVERERAEDPRIGQLG
jgi:hypothetical protein